MYILVNMCISMDFADRCIGNINPYGSKHCLRRYLTLQIIVNYTPVPLPKNLLGSIGNINTYTNIKMVNTTMIDQSIWWMCWWFMLVSACLKPVSLVSNTKCITLGLDLGYYGYHLVMTNIAMENPWQMEVLMGKLSINRSFSMAMLDNQRV